MQLRVISSVPGHQSSNHFSNQHPSRAATAASSDGNSSASTDRCFSILQVLFFFAVSAFWVLCAIYSSTDIGKMEVTCHTWSSDTETGIVYADKSSNSSGYHRCEEEISLFPSTSTDTWEYHRFWGRGEVVGRSIGLTRAAGCFESARHAIRVGAIMFWVAGGATLILFYPWVELWSFSSNIYEVCGSCSSFASQVSFASEIGGGISFIGSSVYLFGLLELYGSQRDDDRSGESTCGGLRNVELRKGPAFMLAYVCFYVVYFMTRLARYCWRKKNDDTATKTPPGVLPMLGDRLCFLSLWIVIPLSIGLLVAAGALGSLDAWKLEFDCDGPLAEASEEYGSSSSVRNVGWAAQGSSFTCYSTQRLLSQSRADYAITKTGEQRFRSFAFGSYSTKSFGSEPSCLSQKSRNGTVAGEIIMFSAFPFSWIVLFPIFVLCSWVATGHLRTATIGFLCTGVGWCLSWAGAFVYIVCSSLFMNSAKSPDCEESSVAVHPGSGLILVSIYFGWGCVVTTAYLLLGCTWSQGGQKEKDKFQINTASEVEAGSPETKNEVTELKEEGDQLETQKDVEITPNSPRSEQLEFEYPHENRAETDSSSIFTSVTTAAASAAVYTKNSSINIDAGSVFDENLLEAEEYVFAPEEDTRYDIRRGQRDEWRRMRKQFVNHRLRLHRSGL